jgi:DNA-binding beta-propeller fold protein YncE
MSRTSAHLRRLLAAISCAALVFLALFAADAPAATGDLAFVSCVEDEDSGLEGVNCPNAPGLNGASGVAVSGDGASAYVASVSDDTVEHFARNPSTGALSFQGCVEDEDSNLEGSSCADAPGLDAAAGVAVSNDGTSVYVPSFDADAIAHFNRVPLHGALSFQGCVEDEDSDLEGASCADAPGLGEAFRVAVSGDGTSVYVASRNDSAIAHFSRNPSTGALSFQGCVEDEDVNFEGASCADAPGLGTVQGIAVSGDGTSVYVASQGDHAIANFGRNPSTGALSFQGCVEDEDSNSEGASCPNAPGLNGAFGVAASGDGTSVYVTSLSDDSVAHFSRNPSTGALSFQSCVEDEDSNLEGSSCADAPALGGLSGAVGVAVSGDEASVYVTSQGDHAVSHFARNISTGALSFQGCVEDEDANSEGASCADAPGLGAAAGVAVSGDGASAYVASFGDDAIAHFSRETPPSPPPEESPAEGGADTSAPDTTITKRPKEKTKKKQATFAFTSSEPGSSFQCAVDGQALKVPCTSPYTVKVKKGKHTFQVRAIDPAGNADATPASDAWKVKKNKK